MRAERELDLELLDGVTWPDYAWEWLRYVGAQPTAPAVPGHTPCRTCSARCKPGGRGRHVQAHACACELCRQMLQQHWLAASERLSSPAALP